MSHASLVTSLVMTSCLLYGGCSSSTVSSGQPDASRDLLEMKERILELQEKAAITEVELARLRQRVRELEGLLGDGDTIQASRPSGAMGTPSSLPQPPDLPDIESGPAPVVEESDLEPEAVPRVESPQEPAASAAEEGASGTAPEAPAGDASGLQPVDPAAQALYDRGYTLYHQGRYLDAEASFQRFLQANPSSELSDNAQFWIGESRYARGDLQGALSAFRETVQRYPEGNKVADALIKEGDCLAGLGDSDGARSRYEDVKRRFPNSAASVMAEERLAGLD